MLRKITLVTLTASACWGGALAAQPPDDVPSAKVHAQLPQVLRSAELHFTPDGSKLLVLRHFSNKLEPVLSVHHTTSKGGEFYHSLVGSDLFGKSELDADRYGSASAAFRREGVRASVSPKAGIFLTSSHKTVRLWQLTTTNQSSIRPYGAPIEHAGSVMAAFSTDGKRLLTATVLDGKRKQDKALYQVRLWEVDTGNPIGEPTTGPARSNSGFGLVMKTLLWSPDDKSFLLAYGSEKQEAPSVECWDAATLKPAGEPVDAAGDFHQFSPDGKTLLVVSAKEASLWNFADRKVIGRVPLGFGGGQKGSAMLGHRFAVAADGTTVLYARAKQVELWDLNAATPVKKHVLDHAASVTWVALSRDGKLAATWEGPYAGRLLVWNLETGRPFLKVPIAAAPRQDEWGTSDGPLKAMAFAPDGRLLATVTDRDVQLWGMETKK